MPGQQALSPFHTRTFLLRSYGGGKGKKAACFLLSTCRQTFDVEADDSLPPKPSLVGMSFSPPAPHSAEPHSVHTTPAALAKRARTSSPIDTDDSSDTESTLELDADMPSFSRTDDSVDALMDESLKLDEAPHATIVREMEAWRETKPRIGDTWYVVPAAWYEQWKTKPHAPAMDLQALCAPNGTLRELAPEEYVLVPTPVWDFLSSRYRIVGTSLGCPVVPGSDGPVVQLVGKTVELALCTPYAPLVDAFEPFVRHGTLPTAQNDTRQALEERVRAMGAPQQVRFFRLPMTLRAVALANRGMVSLSALAKYPIELVDEHTTPLELVGIDVRTSPDEPWHVPHGDQRYATRSSSTPALGLRGLANLGNTCFMNSALQCLSNTPELQQYFARNAHQDELNTDNPLGMGGALAMAYGRLVQSIWAAQQGAVVPREFKMALARYAPQFMGYAQQDSQELLAFLLDGLHEDLNRIHRKPYIEAPDWTGGSDADMVRFAQQQWDLYKARNDSVIVDLFQGQYRSTLVCPVCHKVSIKFDPFMYLTLPIPNTRKWRGRVYFMRPSSPTVQVDVQLPATATIADLRTKVSALVQAEHLVIGEVWSHHVYRWIHDYEPVCDINAGDHIYLWDVGTPFSLPAPRKPPSRFSLFARPERSVEEVENAYSPPPMPDLVCVPVFSCKADGVGRFGSFRRSLGEPLGVPFFVTLPRTLLHQVEGIQDAVERHYLPLSQQDSLEAMKQRAHAMGKDELFQLRVAVPSADEAMHRGDDASEQTTEDLAARASRGGPWPVLFPGAALYALWDSEVAEAVLKPMDRATWGPVSLIQDTDFQQGTAMLAEGRRRAPNLRLEDCLDEFTKEEKLGQDDLWYCPSCRAFQQATKKFDLWKTPDILVVHLKRFSAGRGARDKLDNLIDFPLTSLDLRDRVVGSRLWADLDMKPAPPETRLGDHVLAHDEHDDKVLADTPIYDLYAVDNHYGGLGGGHYTAYAKNPLNGQWYHFDDSSVRPVSDPESTVTSSAAYLLFYRRRTTRPIGGTSYQRLARLHSDTE